MAPPPGAQVPSEIRGKNVEEIIAGWTEELEERSRAFMRHAHALASWDRHIMAGRRKVPSRSHHLHQHTGWSLIFWIIVLLFLLKSVPECMRSALHLLTVAFSDRCEAAAAPTCITLPSVHEQRAQNSWKDRSKNHYKD